MPYFQTDAEIEVDVDDFISSCSQSEIAGLIDCLIDEGYLPQSFRASTNPKINPNGTLASNEFDESVSKLFGNFWRLSNEDAEIINKIADKL